MKFKVGDKVRIVKNIFDFNRCGDTVGIGEVHTIVSYDNNDSYPYVLSGLENWCWCEEELELVPNDKIIITHDGKTTAAKLYRDGETVTATAKCAPEDEFDFMTGVKLAMRRLADKVAPYEWVVVKRKPVVGDYIRIKQADYSFDHVGDILKIDGVGYDDLVYVFEENHPNAYEAYPNFKWNYLKCQYDVVEKVAKNEAPKSKYPDGKYICVGYKTDEKFFTLGKVYEQKNKRIVGDSGFQYEPLSSDSAIEWLEPWYTFIPLVE